MGFSPQFVRSWRSDLLYLPYVVTGEVREGCCTNKSALPGRGAESLKGPVISQHGVLCTDQIQAKGGDQKNLTGRSEI